MKEKFIILYQHEVRGVLRGRQTRITRIMKPQPEGSFTWTASALKECRNSAQYKCPYQVGMRLWVRETWDFRSWGYLNDENGIMLCYAADGVQRYTQAPVYWNPAIYNYERWRPSVHMPRWASRLTIEVTGVRVP